jgi:hypothetical protein
MGMVVMTGIDIVTSMVPATRIAMMTVRCGDRDCYDGGNDYYNIEVMLTRSCHNKNQYHDRKVHDEEIVDDDKDGYDSKTGLKDVDEADDELTSKWLFLAQ